MDSTTKRYLNDLEKQLDEARDDLSCAIDLCDGQWITRIESRISKIQADIMYAKETIAKEYRSNKYVCFDCRTTATRPADIGGQTPICPECRNPMRCMGIDFKRPKKNDKKAWKEAQNSYLWSR